jgi:hypothetical protein
MPSIALDLRRAADPLLDADRRLPNREQGVRGAPDTDDKRKEARTRRASG